jgi:hypothetical protein
LACNFLATETVPEGRLRRTRSGSPYPALAAGGVVIKPLEDRSLAILNHPDTAKMIRNLIDWLIISGSGEESDKKTGPTLLCGRIKTMMLTKESDLTRYTARIHEIRNSFFLDKIHAIQIPS